MSNSTTKWTIPYPTAPDTVASTPATIANLAARLDVLMGESGQFTWNMVANTQINQAITLSRTYNVGPSIPGLVELMHFTGFASGQTCGLWVGTWATTGGLTGFTVSGMSNVTVTRTIYWRFMPVA